MARTLDQLADGVVTHAAAQMRACRRQRAHVARFALDQEDDLLIHGLVIAVRARHADVDGRGNPLRQLRHPAGRHPGLAALAKAGREHGAADDRSDDGGDAGCDGADDRAQPLATLRRGRLVHN